MEKIHLKLDDGVPQFACTPCCSCSSVYGKSLCSIKNRGCCWYFPKFALHDIHKMVHSQEGLDLVYNILKLPGVVVYSNFIHAKGYFDEEGYKRFLESRKAYKYDVADKTIFFRLCPFSKPGEGCSMPVKFRSYVCNFFICSEFMEKVQKYDLFKTYIRERDRYIGWIERENHSLEIIIREKGTSLTKDFNEVIRILRDIPYENYEFPELEEIQIDDGNGFDIGA